MKTPKVYKLVGCSVTATPFLMIVSFSPVSRSLPSAISVILLREVIVIADVEASYLLTKGPASHSSSLFGQMEVARPVLRRSEPCRCFRGKTLFSRCSVAFTSLLAAQVHAFKKLFLKLSLKNAYSIGFIAEFE